MNRTRTAPLKRPLGVTTHWLIGALMVAFVGVTFPSDADARRFGGARSSGLQRSMPARTAPNAPPPKPATPAPAQQANPGAATAGAAAAAPKRSWMGPIAGLAAGLGLAALMSHLGMGEGFANMIMMALLAVGAFLLIRFVMRRMNVGARGPTPAMAGAGLGTGAGSAGERASAPAWPQQPAARVEAPALQREALGEAATGAAAAAAAGVSASSVAASSTGVTRAFVPASFDSDGFTRTAKMIFIRMQAANDAADLDDLRRFTTPELFASLRLDLQDRGPAPQQTDVQRVDADVLDVADEDGRQVVSVRFHGLIVEEKGTAANAFDEVWHLVRPLDESQPWAIAGIEQMA